VHQYFGHCHPTHTQNSYVHIFGQDLTLFMVNISVMILITTWWSLPTKFQILSMFSSLFLVVDWLNLPIKVFFVIQIFKQKAVLYHHEHVSTYHVYQLHVCWIWLEIWCYCTVLNWSHISHSHKTCLLQMNMIQTQFVEGEYASTSYNQERSH